MSFWMILSLIVGLIVCIRFFYELNKKIAFIEFFLMLYAINFLLSPIFIYSLPSYLVTNYNMVLPPDEYFPMALLAFGAMAAGVYILGIPPIFAPNINLLKVESVLHEKMLKQWVVGGIALFLISAYTNSEIGFLIYLLSLVRFIGAFSLFIMDYRKFRWYVLAVIVVEFLYSLRYGMFHDFLMWLIFFIILTMYIFKFSTIRKLIFVIVGAMFIFVIQTSKVAYRQAVSQNEAGVETFITVANTKELQNNTHFWESDNFITAVTRLNQSWILNSTIDNMDRTQNFQGITILKKYLEAAILPRLLAADKLKAGDKKIFNTYSGHYIGDNTSMALGVFADGYVAYGVWGLFLYAFFFGLIFNLIFKMVNKWSKTSPFFFLFLFPILNYAVRPDCELQTILGYVFKSVVLFSLLVWYYSYQFKKQMTALQKQLDDELGEGATLIV